MSTGANLLTRTASKCVDFILVFAIMEALPGAGWLAGILYVLISDGLMEGQSLGKKLIGLRVIGPEGRPCDIKGSILRNASLGVGLFFYRVPVLGWILLLALAGFEFVTLIGSPEDRRFGDEMAGTRVVEIKNQDDRRDEIA